MLLAGAHVVNAWKYRLNEANIKKKLGNLFRWEARGGVLQLFPLLGFRGSEVIGLWSLGRRHRFQNFRPKFRLPGINFRRPWSRPRSVQVEPGLEPTDWDLYNIIISGSTQRAIFPPAGRPYDHLPRPEPSMLLVVEEGDKNNGKKFMSLNNRHLYSHEYMTWRDSEAKYFRCLVFSCKTNTFLFRMATSIFRALSTTPATSPV